MDPVRHKNNSRKMVFDTATKCKIDIRPPLWLWVDVNFRFLSMDMRDGILLFTKQVAVCSCAGKG